MKPIEAVRHYCLYCMNNQPGEIKQCPSLNCPLYFLRSGRNESPDKETALKAIQKYCFDCSGNCNAEVKKCTFADCSLYPFRSGRNPQRAGIGGKAGNREALQKYRDCLEKPYSRPDFAR